jgi:hypothetical protein
MISPEAAAIWERIEQIDCERAELMARLRELLDASSAIPVRVQPARRRKVDATDAFRRNGYAWSDEKIQRVCRNHAGTWAVKLGSWCVIEPDFGDFVAAVERGEAKFKFLARRTPDRG